MNSRTACAGRLLPLLLLLALPTVVQAQYNYTTNNGTITITRYTRSAVAVVVTIPSMLNGLPVASIGYGAFSSCSRLTSVTIPNSVTHIGDGAFSLCSRLTSVTIPNSVTSIGHEAFYRCTSLTSVTIGTSVTSIGDLAFFFCTNLTSVTIGPSVTSIGNYAFRDCTRLMGVYFQGNAPSLSLGYTVFYYANHATVYYLAGTTGWTNPWGNRPIALWQQQTNQWSSGATDLGGGWKRLSWFGDYADLGSSWIWHSQHGYEYVYSLSTPTSISFWDYSGLGWLWTSSTVYPYLYRVSDGAWLWYLSGASSPRWFYNLTAGQWESH